MFQYYVLAIAVGLLEGVWMYYSLAKADRPDFTLFKRTAKAEAAPKPAFAGVEKQAA